MVIACYFSYFFALNCYIFAECFIMQMHSKLCVSTLTTLSGLQEWADLPDGLLHSILPLLGSVRDLLAFAATCHSWRVAFLSYPSKSTLCTLFPPLLIQTNIRVDAPHVPSNDSHCKLRTCKVIDPSNQNITLRCQIDEETLQKMYCVGPSYGHLIFLCSRGYCLVVDPFSGSKVSPPRLPISGCERVSPTEIQSQHSEIAELYFFVVLTAPITSPNSHLLVGTRFSLFDWPVGSDSWSELKLPSGVQITQIVEFKGQFIAMDCHRRIYTFELAPQLGLQEVRAEWSYHSIRTPWLVVCGDMLLMVITVDYWSRRISDGGILKKVCTLHLDMSSKPAEWVVKKKLGSWAVFVGCDTKNMPLSNMNPERWGGRSNSLYYAESSPPWRVHELDSAQDPCDASTRQCEIYWGHHMKPLWVYPSMLYSDGQ